MVNCTIDIEGNAYGTDSSRVDAFIDDSINSDTDHNNDWTTDNNNDDWTIDHNDDDWITDSYNDDWMK